MLAHSLLLGNCHGLGMAAMLLRPPACGKAGEESLCHGCGFEGRRKYRVCLSTSGEGAAGQDCDASEQDAVLKVMGPMS